MPVCPRRDRVAEADRAVVPGVAEADPDFAPGVAAAGPAAVQAAEEEDQAVPPAAVAAPVSVQAAARASAPVVIQYGAQASHTWVQGVLFAVQASALIWVQISAQDEPPAGAPASIPPGAVAWIWVCAQGGLPRLPRCHPFEAEREEPAPAQDHSHRRSADLRQAFARKVVYDR